MIASGSHGRHPSAGPLAAVVAAALGLACASSPRLVPGADLPRPPGPGTGTAVREAGVRVEARTNAWRWQPEALSEELTPVLLEITNESERPLRVRYSELWIRTPGEGRLAALPPLSLEGSVAAPLGPYAYHTRRFHVAPHLHGYYAPHLGVHVGHFAHDPHYYGHHGPSIQRLELPTESMLVRALPEGVVQPGGRVTGFVYFEELAEEPGAQGPYALRFDLVDARTEEPFGRVEIPFERVEGELGEAP